MSKFTPERLRQWAEFVTWDEPDYRKPSVSDIRNQLDAHADALEERQELIAALTGAVALIDGDLVGADWKAACREFTKDARALLARMDT